LEVSEVLSLSCDLTLGKGFVVERALGVVVVEPVDFRIIEDLGFRYFEMAVEEGRGGLKAFGGIVGFYRCLVFECSQLEVRVNLLDGRVAIGNALQRTHERTWLGFVPQLRMHDSQN
jgi:hypothetical protein